MVFAACGSSSDAIPEEVLATFDVEGSWIADLTEPGDEPFDPQLVLASIGRARAAGTELRVVVVGSQDERPSPKAIVDKYGGTVLVYKANDGEFFAHSGDMPTDQVERAAQGAASDQRTISDSVAGFVRTVSSEGIQGSSIFDTLLRWVLLPLAALFMIVMLLRYLRARNGARKRTDQFLDRKRSLSEWAGQLPGEIDSLRGAVALASDESRITLHEVDDFASGIGSKIAAAENMGELDAAEMRLGRAFIKLRELGKAVSA